MAGKELNIAKLILSRLTFSLLIVCLPWLMAASNAQDLLIFSDRHEAEIKRLIAQMTVEEKEFQLASYYYARSKHSNANVRLGIPNLVAGEGLHGAMADDATSFPMAIAMASTWDTELIETMGNVVALEARACGIHQCYAPMIAVVRDVRWGRVEESFGEDPFLVGSIGTAYIKGLQGTGLQRFDRNHILACAKHYVADGEPMAGANGAAMDVSDYNLHNIHLYPFRMAFEEAGVASIMPAHHILNGIPCHANKYILNDILRGQYKWNGLVVSDNQDLPRMVKLFGYAAGFDDAALKALEAGVHQELDLSVEFKDRVYGTGMADAVRKGIIPEKLLDEAVAVNLRAKFDLGLFDTEKPSAKDYTVLNNAPPIKNSKEKHALEILKDRQHDSLALEIAHKAIILLKNEKELLPLNIASLKRIAVIGPNADAVRLGGYSRGRVKYFVTILDGIKKYAGNKIEVVYAEGAGIDTESHLSENDISKDIEVTRYAEKSRSGLYTSETKKIADAVELAGRSDVVILAIGGSEATCRENEDTDNLDLTGRQLELVQAVQATGRPCVVVLLGGRPLSIPWIADNIPAIVQGWYLGQETGTAVADVLFGKVNPGGKLPVTVPRNVGQVPLFYNKLEPGRPRKIYRSSPEPLFRFGFGLSYTTFKISNISLGKDTISPDEKTVLSADVTNTGKTAGDEVVQLYIRAINSSRVRPVKEMRGFQRIHLDPGQVTKVSFEIGKKQLEYWNGDWKVESGLYYLSVAADSSDEQTELNKIRLYVRK